MAIFSWVTNSSTRNTNGSTVSNVRPATIIFGYRAKNRCARWAMISRSSLLSDTVRNTEFKLTCSFTMLLCSVIIRSVSPKRWSNSAFRFIAYRRTTSPTKSAAGRYQNRCSMSSQ